MHRHDINRSPTDIYSLDAIDVCGLLMPRLVIEITVTYTNRERANMHCQGIACTRSFDMGLTSADGQKLECFK
jgi:hypothetical protein